ncbi:MAG: four helix bundle protein [Desulfobacteraceae bacterium]|nr:four helix bundle protein [Desulfobacteraceae bacterium]
MLKNYKELKVWQKSYELCLEIYRITAKFPKEERYGLTSQIRRSAENKHLNPGPLGPFLPTNWEKSHSI